MSMLTFWRRLVCMFIGSHEWGPEHTIARLVKKRRRRRENGEPYTTLHPDTKKVCYCRRCGTQKVVE